MKEEEKEEISPNIDVLNQKEEDKEEIIPNIELLNQMEEKNSIYYSKSIEQSIIEAKKNKSCYFPSAHLILLILEVIIFSLTYIIPKGKYNCIKYFEEGDKFIIYAYNTTRTPIEITKPATQEVLNEYNITIPLENFKKGYVKEDVAIPNSYKRLPEVKNIPFYNVLKYPILGLIDCADIAFFLMMIAGCLNILIEMKSFLAAMEALSRCGKNSGIILLILVYFILSVGGSALGFEEQILAFYPALMPAYIRCGIDGALAAASIYFGSIVGNMFSTINPFGTVIGSYLAGINFMNGIVFRVVAFIIGDGMVIGYFIFYHIRVTKYPKESAVYGIRRIIRSKVLGNEEENDDEKNVDNQKENDDEKNKDNKKGNDTSLNEVDNVDNEKVNLKKVEFTCIQKISLLLFLLAFIVMIVGVTVLKWWFEEMGTVFFVLGIILIILARRGEIEGIEIFAKGAGDFVSIILIVGIARGINITLSQGLIEDTVLYALSGLVKGISKIAFAIIILFAYMILGFFIQNGTGLAVLSIPVFAPLCDQVHCSKNVLINAFMYGQNVIEFISPTGLSLIVSQIVGMSYKHWLKFVWKIMIPLFILLIILVIVDSVLEK